MVNYPREDEVKEMIKWYEGVDKVSMSSCDIGEELKKTFELTEQARAQQWDRIFGDQSPWRAFRTNSGKIGYNWDDDKASSLGYNWDDDKASSLGIE